MSENIVARLRMWADDRDIYKKAADEIEKGDRLIDDLRHERNVLQKICAERVAEIERLRAALREISKLTPDSYLSFDSFAIDYARMTALAALAGEKKDD